MITILFYVFAAMAVGCSIGVVVSRNPIGSLLFMTVALFSIAGTFVLMEAHFLAAVQVIVYAGAIMVLFLFVIMLLNLGHEAVSDLKWGLSSLLAFAVVGAMAGLLARQLGAGEGVTATPTGAQAIQAAMQEHGAIGAIAEPLYTTYVVPFEITGILLLVAIVGAVALAKRSV
jgi:NADH-quinone oxidoreductase subunit J